jgi:NAD(P)-dependent dehydrogenase (short-subunit alcohol dehydrogenase family)
MNIENQVLLVTGANRGLGRELALAGLAAGARRVYAGARDPRKLEPLVAAGAGRIVALQVDVTREDSLAAAAEIASDLSLLINNAGVLASYGVLSSTKQALEQDFAINFFGVVAATRAFLPALERAGARGAAGIVNVLSVVSLANLPGLGGYSASKAAAHSLTQALRSDLGPRGVRVHGVFAGAIDTDMTRGMDMPKARPADVASAILRGVAAGTDDIFPDAMSEGISATWRSDPKQLERQMASMGG